ncbi:30S ribosomal protein S1 [Fictibacillus macauensis ZFHKF-1]|uniref:30S ribosomal protein S1 n=1 Tax=Fictibacillus macauensis ZFHKF-1 TaxID=1196324 RepID=I8UIC4_9BACL|nr:30S ribosomal protein S1 [Fictibacillus macauensis]EIT86573.1 30S ribosomal protein S1 [Fictibacillus macauensis ZFHKF-1]
MTEEMNTSLEEAKVLVIGEITEGTVLKIEDKLAILDVKYKQDAILPINEVSNVAVDHVSDVLQVGDRVTVKVLAMSDEQLTVSKKAVDSVSSWSELHAKLESQEVFSVTVLDVVKGGLVADVGVRGFIPASMVDTAFIDDFSSFKNKTLTVKVVELDQEKNRVILSHRIVLEEEEAAKKQNRLSALEPGQVITGTVRRMTNFGAFVDLGGIDGLVHISQLSYQRVEHPSEVVEEGQEVAVKVLSVDRDNDRVSLSIKDVQPGPWASLPATIASGAIVTGTVKRLTTFGAFVEVAPNVEGLVHISEMSSRHIGKPSEVVSVGETVTVKILELTVADKRMSLSMKAVEEAENAADIKENFPKEEKGFSLGDMLGEQLKNLQRK